MTLAFPERGRRLRRDALAPVGVLAECPLPVADTCLALEQIGARDWASYGGWGSYADASMRRGWVQHRQRKGLVLAMSIMNLFGGGGSGFVDAQRPDGGWLNLVVLPHVSGTGSTIEIRADLDAEMYTSVRSAVRGLFVTIVRVWDPTLP